MYKVRFSEKACCDALSLKKEEPKAYVKLGKLILELAEHPTTGTGKPERLKYVNVNVWSRRINKKHRLVYTIDDETVIVDIISAHGHYNDK